MISYAFLPRYCWAYSLYPQVFIIDDTASMRDYWSDLCRLFEILGYLVKKSDGDGIDMYFTMTEKKYNSKDISGLVEILKKRKNSLGDSNINYRLANILEDYCRSLKNEHELRGGGSRSGPADGKKPLSVYIFTNALWSPKSGLTIVIKNVVNNLIKLGYPSSQVGIEFISFGDNPETLTRLEYYASGLGLEMYTSETIQGLRVLC